MLSKFIYVISGIMIAIVLPISALQAAGSELKSSKQPLSDTVNSTSTNEGQRAVLTVSPIEIDLGSIRRGGSALGEFILKNIGPGGMEWADFCAVDLLSGAG